MVDLLDRWVCFAKCCGLFDGGNVPASSAGNRRVVFRYGGAIKQAVAAFRALAYSAAIIWRSGSPLFRTMENAKHHRSWKRGGAVSASRTGTVGTRRSRRSIRRNAPAVRHRQRQTGAFLPLVLPAWKAIRAIFPALLASSQEGKSTCDSTIESTFELSCISQV